MTSGLHLENSSGGPDDLKALWPCVRTAEQEIQAGQTELSSEEQRALGGRDVSGFLFWGSFFSGPRPVVRDGRPAEQESSLAFSGDEQLTQRYVLCLLRNGYRWPPEAVTERPRPRPDPASPANG